jgi:hypothetical protein
MFNQIWKNQVVLSKFAHISLDISDQMTQFQYESSFNALKEIAKEQEDAMKQNT